MKEEEIRPRDVFDEYLRLAALDADLYFAHTVRQNFLCPACGEQGAHSFDKHGFSYQECPACHTLFVSPRPPAEAFYRYYQESDSARFFATTFYKETAEPRREKLWRPKAQLINQMLRKHGADRHTLLDIGGGYGIFAEEYQRLYGNKVTIIEPGPELAHACRQKGLTVIEDFLEKVQPEQLPIGPRAFVSFELFEHLHDPRVFLKHLSALMQSGDMFLFTTLSGTGIDIQLLWEESKSISLQHLNFLNPESVCPLIEGMGLQVVDVRTPGKLDMDILYNNRARIKDRFWRSLLARSTEQQRAEWQDFIVGQNLSSHMSVVCKCP
ncbi:MAG: class I SAM-dependent methyltransferase [Burkholderiaceae bacterium]|nr:MAG: class I SAM-dependent methyltransferase [Burkholderiaceae bacterium]